MERIKEAVELAKADRARLSGVVPQPQMPRQLPPVPTLQAGEGSTSSQRHVRLSSDHLRSMRIIANDVEDPRGRGFEMLRTQIIRKMTDSRYQTIGITSPTSGCGKTVCAVNLALSIARLPEKSVILVDLDLRKPQVAAYLGLPPGVGVDNLLRDEAQLNEIIVAPEMGAGRLRVLPTYRASRNAAVQMASSDVAEMVQKLRSQNPDGLILFDLPPVLVADDVISFLPHLDCILLVVAAGQTTAGDISNSERLLGATEGSRVTTEILGIVLNKAEEGGDASYYY